MPEYQTKPVNIVWNHNYHNHNNIITLPTYLILKVKIFLHIRMYILTPCASLYNVMDNIGTMQNHYRWPACQFSPATLQVARDGDKGNRVGSGGQAQF